MAILSSITFLFALCGCTEPVPGALEQVIDGRFEHWPDGDGDDGEGDAWRQVGDVTLDVGSAKRLSIRTGTSGGGAETLIPVSPGRTLRLSLRHKGSAGQLQLILDDGAEPLEADLPPSDGWLNLEAEVVPQRDGIRLRLLDDADDAGALLVDDVSLAPMVQGDVTHEPPIRIVPVIHAKAAIEDESEYWDRRAQIDDAVELAESFGLVMTILLSGPHAEWVVTLGDEAYYRDLQLRGHEIGTHVLPTYHQAALSWLSGDMFDDGMADREWDDHRSWVDQVVEPATNTTVCAYAPLEQMPALMVGHGFTLDLSSAAVNTPDGVSRESTPWAYLGHHPHQPFRPADDPTAGHELQGDRDAPYVTITHAAQVGRQEAHSMPCSVDDYERYAHLMIDRWTAHQRQGTAPGGDLVWVFGIGHHAWDEGDYLDDLRQIFEILDVIALGATSDEGNPVASAATASQVLDEFEAWELDHPDAPGWSFTLPP